MKKILLATAAVASLSLGAQAADLGAARGPVAASVYAPAFSWTGFYAGAQLGYGWAHQGWSTAGGGFDRPWRSNGIFGGVHIGFNYQINMLVLGVQAEANAASIGGTVIDGGSGRTFTGRTNAFGSLDLRAGLAVDRALLYVIGGLALTDNRHRTFPTGGGPLTDATFRQNRVGWNIGAGVEYAFAPNWSARVEYRYYDFGNASYPDTGSLIAHSHKHNMHTVRLGLSYLFSTGSSAVVARY
ncbi:MAG: porin family protein [Phreatobacter sp.]|uniref:outer membrane protein n=1 Tax=Phreatobacter sp. TaxID=1966341 RepID=UPI001A4B15E0|nr:outer membrane protein [Phreatobacter sp.]MBL8569852.1 porin family protein [Phreatobacter sp.]